MHQNSIHPSSELRKQIENEIVNPGIESDVRKVVRGRDCWRTIAVYTEGTSHLLVAVGCVLAYIAGAFNSKAMVFSVGICNALAVALLRFSVYATNEYQELQMCSEKMLDELGLPQLSPTLSKEQEAGTLQRVPSFQIHSPSPSSRRLTEQTEPEPQEEQTATTAATAGAKYEYKFVRRPSSVLDNVRVAVFSTHAANHARVTRRASTA